MLSTAAPHAKSAHTLMDIGVAAFPSLAITAPSADLDGDVDRFTHLVCGTSDYASDLLHGRRPALLFPNVAGAPLKRRECDGVMRVGATSVAYYHLVTAPCMHPMSSFGLIFFFNDEAASDWRDYRIPFGQAGLMSSLGLEGAHLLRLRPYH